MNLNNKTKAKGLCAFEANAGTVVLMRGKCGSSSEMEIQRDHPV